jgi:hypothetical protein
MFSGARQKTGVPVNGFFSFLSLSLSCAAAHTGSATINSNNASQ